jgi:4-amino-4-deoxy-L-arabinose transferase-like glycosyltransferase
LAVAALLSLQVCLAVRSLVQENPTVDEVVHLPAGITYWQTGTFRLYHHNPPLVRMIAALPVLPLGPKLDYALGSWKREPPNKQEFAHDFMRFNARGYFELFTAARLVMPLFAVVGGLVVFLWSKRLYGAGGALLSLALWTFCPNVLAHTRLVTTDMGATALGVLATYVFWRYLHRPTWRRALLAGLALGLAQLAKFSLITLYGFWPLLALLGLIAGELARRRAPSDAPPGPPSLAPGAGVAGGLPLLGRTVLHGLIVVAVSVLVIDIGYAFEGVGLRLGDYEFTCATLTRPVPPGMHRPRHSDGLLDGAYHFRINRFRDTLLGALPVPLPKHYLLGFDDQKLEAEGIPQKFLMFHQGGEDVVRHAGPEGETIKGYPVYLDGQLSQRSWWYYYLLTLAYKVPEGTWLLVLASLAVLATSPRSRAPWFDELTVLAVPAFVLFVMSVFTNINLGLRYVLPIFPYVYIAAGKLVPWASGLPPGRGRRAAWGLVAAGLAATVAATALIHPHYLAYFNAVSGGPDRGAEHLIDSNIDWGQDLVGLRRWLERNAPGERVGLAYFGQINPRVFDERGEGFDWFLPPPEPGSMLPPTTPENLAGIPIRYRTSIDSLRLEPGLYAVSATLVKGLPWRVYDRPVAIHEADRWAPWEVWFDAFRYFDELTPIDKVGDSIWIYRVSPEQAERLSRRLAPR